MSNDLLFSVLPREGKVAVTKEELKVKKVEKEAKLRRLNDEEKSLVVDERDAREHQKKEPKSSNTDSTEDENNAKDHPEGEGITQDEHGNKHLDIYI